MEESHYFLERNGVIEELYYYSFHKVINNKTYLLHLDKYKDQLRELAASSLQFNDSLPLYQEKYLKKYIVNYNMSFSDHEQIYRSDGERYTFDLDINTGFENWTDGPRDLNKKITYGFGARLNFPRRYHNRYVKINFFITPNMPVGQRQTYQEVNLKTFEIAVGSYLGKRKLLPYAGFHYSGVGGNYRLDFVGFQTGISYKKRINLEIGHFVNLAAMMSETALFARPRISLHYLANLNFTR